MKNTGYEYVEVIIANDTRKALLNSSYFLSLHIQSVNSKNVIIMLEEYSEYFDIKKRQWPSRDVNKNTNSILIKKKRQWNIVQQ